MSLSEKMGRELIQQRRSHPDQFHAEVPKTASNEQQAHGQLRKRPAKMRERFNSPERINIPPRNQSKSDQQSDED